MAPDCQEGDWTCPDLKRPTPELPLVQGATKAAWPSFPSISDNSHWPGPSKPYSVNQAHLALEDHHTGKAWGGLAHRYVDVLWAMGWGWKVTAGTQGQTC